MNTMLIVESFETELEPITRLQGLTQAQRTAVTEHIAFAIEVLEQRVNKLFDDHAEEIDRLNEQVGETLNVVREAADRLPTVFILHEDAKRFGWQDRDEEAWHIITDLHAGIADACRAANIVA